MEFNSTRIKIRYEVFAGGIIGAVVYMFIFGTSLLDVTNDAWLRSKGDLTQHYCGWMFFRNSKWYFPIGLMDTITYPDVYSIVFTDAIPIMAVLFKILSPILPDTFQYFGIWGLMCFVLQGGISVLLLKKILKHSFSAIVGALFFILSPWMIQRMYMHTSLAAHWIILLCFYMCIIGNDIQFKKYIINWSIIFALAASIHVYFIPMAMMILGIFTLYRAWNYRKNIRSVFIEILSAFIPVLTAIIVLWMLGAFYGSTSLNVGGLGEASANLNFLFDSVGYSKYLPALPNPLSKWRQESFGYLGIGIFIMAITSIVFLLHNIKKYLKILTMHCTETVFIILFIILCLDVCTAPTVAFNNHILFTWNMPQILTYLLGIFRSLGRFVWLISYLCIIGILLLLEGKFEEGISVGPKNKYTYRYFFGMAFLVICFIIQIDDLSKMIKDKHNYAVAEYRNDSFNEMLWDSFINDYEHIYTFDTENWQSITFYAGKKKITLNQSYLSRIDNKKLLRELNQKAMELSEGIVDEKTIYLMPLNQDLENSNRPKEMHWYRLENCYIGTLNAIDILSDKELI